MRLFFFISYEAHGVLRMLAGNFYVSCSLEGNWDALGTMYALGDGCCREALKFLDCDVVEYVF